VAFVPVSETVPLVIPSRVAVICVVPPPWPKATPDCAPMMATAVFDEVQFTLEVMFCVVPSLYVPVAENATVPRGATEAVGGEMAMDWRVAFVTVSETAGLVMPLGDELEAGGPRTIGEPVACRNCVTAFGPWLRRMVIVLST